MYIYVTARAKTIERRAQSPERERAGGAFRLGAAGIVVRPAVSHTAAGRAARRTEPGR